jgi:hypothetical protein
VPGRLARPAPRLAERQGTVSVYRFLLAGAVVAIPLGALAIVVGHDKVTPWFWLSVGFDALWASGGILGSVTGWLRVP